MSTAVDTESKRTTPSWRRLLVVLAVVAVALLATAYVFREVRATNRLQRLLADLDDSDPGWRLDEIEARREEIPDKDNSARVVTSVVKMLRGGFPSLRDTSAGDGVPLPAPWSRERREAVEKVLAPFGAEIALARTLAEMPRGRHHLSLEVNPYWTATEDQQHTRRVMGLLALDAQRLTQRGEMAQAIRSCRATANAGRSIGDEPFFVTQIIRRAGVTLANDELERCLSQGPGDEAELGKLAELLADEEKHPALVIAWRGERAAAHVVLDGLGAGKFSFDDPVFPHERAPVLREKFAGWHLRQQVRAEHPLLLDWCSRAIAIARLPAHEQARPERDLQRDMDAARDSILMASLLLPSVERQGVSHRTSLALVRGARVLIAVERHRLAKGAWPATPENLPLDPFDGKPLRYVRHAGGVTVYSIGPNGKDDGGAKIDRGSPHEPGVDVGYQLWDVEKRGKAPVAK